MEVISTKLNIVILISCLPSGGAEKQALLLANILSECYNVKVVIVIDEINEKHLEYIKLHNIEVVKILGNPVKRMFALYKFLKTNKVDFIFSYLLTGNFFGGLVGTLAGTKHRIGGVRAALLLKKKVFIESVLHNYFNSYTIFNNYRGANFYASKSFNRKKIHVIQNCISIPSKQEYVKSEIFEIITVGRFVMQKDYYSAISVVKHLVDSGIKDFRYTIIGWGKLEMQVREWIKELGVEDYVRLLINPGNVMDYYKSSHIYLCTSVFEGLSNTIMEAMSFSLPCIVTNVGDNELLVKDGFNGVVVNAGDVKSIAKSVVKLKNDSTLRITMGDNSYKRINQKFSVQVFKDNYLNFIKSVVQNKKPVSEIELKAS